MKKVLQVAIFVLLALIVFYLFKIDFEDNLFSETNKPFALSIMFSVLGLLCALIMMQARKLKKL